METIPPTLYTARIWAFTDPLRSDLLETQQQGVQYPPHCTFTDPLRSDLLETYRDSPVVPESRRLSPILCDRTYWKPVRAILALFVNLTFTDPLRSDLLETS